MTNRRLVVLTIGALAFVGGLAILSSVLSLDSLTVVLGSLYILDSGYQVSCLAWVSMTGSHS
jgi:hypothetical protein